MKRGVRKRLLLITIIIVFFGRENALAIPSVRDITAVDVTTRSFSVIWATNEAVTNATLTVFSNSNGTNNITPTLPPLVFASSPAAATNGVVKVIVLGLVSDTTVCFQTHTTAASGTMLSPSAPPFPCVTTETETSLHNDAQEPITNDLLRFDLLAVDQTSPLAGALLVLGTKGGSQYSLSSFAGEGVLLPTAVANLRNLFDATTHSTADLIGNEILEVKEFRGLANGQCALQDHLLFHFRRVPLHEEEAQLGVRISELEDAGLCFFADTVCDDRVDILDVQRVLNVFNEQCGRCRFNPDLDIVDDCAVNILDVQSVLNRFGQQAPFAP